MRVLRLLLLFVMLSAGLCPAEEARHKGRPIHLWLEELVDDNQEKRESAERELKIMGTNALPTLYGYVTSLGSAFSSHHSSIVYHAFRILGESAKPAIPHLVALFNDPNYTSDAASALMMIGVESALPLTSTLTNTNPGVRAKVMDTLTFFALDSKSSKPFTNGIAYLVVPAILPALKDTNTTVVMSAIRALTLVSTNSEQVCQAIVPFLKSKNWDVRMTTIACLEGMGKNAKHSFPTLLERLNDEDQRIRDHAARALLTIDKEEATKLGVKLHVYE
jgi:HEAT repeat protein